jgi:hypothetical protein
MRGERAGRGPSTWAERGGLTGRGSGDESLYVVEVLGHLRRHGRVEDFEPGVDLVLDGLERSLEQE